MQFLSCRDLKETLANVAEQVKKDVNECLVQHGFSQLDEKKSKLLTGQICDLASSGNAVTTLMSECLELSLELCLYSRT